MRWVLTVAPGLLPCSSPFRPGGGNHHKEKVEPWGRHGVSWAHPPPSDLSGLPLWEQFLPTQAPRPGITGIRIKSNCPNSAFQVSQELELWCSVPLPSGPGAQQPQPSGFVHALLPSPATCGNPARSSRCPSLQVPCPAWLWSGRCPAGTLALSLSSVCPAGLQTDIWGVNSKPQLLGPAMECHSS